MIVEFKFRFLPRFYPSLDLKHFVDAELSLEEDRIKRSKRFGV